jgi:hypothetical protein
MADRTGLLSGPNRFGQVAAPPDELRRLSNNSVVIRLHNTINHLSRWLTPIHDPTRLSRSVRRGEPSVKDLLIQLRDEELRTFPKMYLVSVHTNPDLDKLPLFTRTSAQLDNDARHSPLSIMSEYRRLRHSTLSMLRSLPDDAWARSGFSRREHNWTLRQLAEHLLTHDYDILAQMDEALDRTGAREGLASAQRAHLDELLHLNPSETRN